MEIKQRSIIDMAADQGAYICQSQSLALDGDQPNFAKLTSMHFHCTAQRIKDWYILPRTKAAADAIKFTVDVAALNRPQMEEQSTKRDRLLTRQPRRVPGLRQLVF